jgi:hypothetical protein
MPKRLVFLLVILVGRFALAAEPIPSDWIDPDTGHRIIRLSEQNGSRTLYFHDNSYTPEGDKLIFNTPSGVAVVDITQLGIAPVKMEIVTQGGGAIMARRSREVYVTRGGRAGSTTQPEAQAAIATTGRGFGGGFGGRGGPVYAFNVDTKAARLIPNAVSTLISCDESFNFIVDRGAVDPTGNTPRPATRPYVPQLQRMFPGKDDGRPDAGSSGMPCRRRRGWLAADTQPVAGGLHVHQSQDRREKDLRLSIRQPRSPAMVPHRSDAAAVRP